MPKRGTKTPMSPDSCCMVKSKQLHQTQQEKVQKACAKLLEDRQAGNTPNISRARGLTSAADLRPWEAEKAAHAEIERRKAEATHQREARQAAARDIRDARGPTVVFSGTQQQVDTRKHG
ncbi:hypothetical protein BDR04DRAFT_1140431 [Suillus decipiens]|nr:hypothetical protein BDR04DRAFT_1140431 [Suillus decipiens]